MAVAKFKILCLHGIGTNSEIFEAQIAGLIYELGTDYDFQFIDGAYPWPAAPGIREMFGDQICYSYYDGSAQSAYQAVDDLAAYACSNGPYDAVLGFSLGATLAATLLLRDADQELCKPDQCRPGGPTFRCAFFFCGTLPCDWHQLELGEMKFLDAGDIKQPIQIQTLHVWSPADVAYPGQSAQVADMCDNRKKKVVTHGEGHAIPSQRGILTNIANDIRELVAKTDT
ncbi:Esterase [Lachnellula hyalina]|uniref:Esterase n=1 Tax=Lachnellula hyalina TaxID=1316788 RepID=A0A8H8R8P7_9HELO|nr:Esterase [Lachnellula hyalina]TVY30664.1 Esterase [Lachnellula hyalina]